MRLTLPQLILDFNAQNITNSTKVDFKPLIKKIFTRKLIMILMISALLGTLSGYELHKHQTYTTMIIMQLLEWPTYTLLSYTFSVILSLAFLSLTFNQKNTHLFSQWISACLSYIAKTIGLTLFISAVAVFIVFLDSIFISIFLLSNEPNYLSLILLIVGVDSLLVAVSLETALFGGLINDYVLFLSEKYHEIIPSLYH